MIRMTFAMLFLTLAIGCGGEENKVITHTEDYEFSELELKNKELEREARN